MSWIFAVFGNNKAINEEAIKSIHPIPLYQKQSANLYFAVGGIKETCRVKLFSKTGNKGYIFAGLGIRKSTNSYAFISHNEWDDLAFKSEKELHKIQGHFSLIRWEEGEIECITDRLGLRSLYLTNINNTHTVISTRMDWIAKVNPKSKVNLKHLVLSGF